MAKPDQRTEHMECTNTEWRPAMTRVKSWSLPTVKYENVQPPSQKTTASLQISTSESRQQQRQCLGRAGSGADINLTTKYSLYKSLVVPIMLQGCKTWSLLAATERKIQPFECKCLGRLLWISYKEHSSR